MFLEDYFFTYVHHYEGEHALSNISGEGMLDSFKSLKDIKLIPDLRNVITIRYQGVFVGRFDIVADGSLISFTSFHSTEKIFGGQNYISCLEDFKENFPSVSYTREISKLIKVLKC